ncbi:DUF6386 family protein [Gimesia fumaroli]|uniref:Uncharacterized protein n=1 Tax=Gimesia fumaroli TaxID=2527976 RepID=A0A518ILN8_9PLAN|nr:DUF6386 family protein [Gimesia fumaroli]QDV54019.1 hypothetical protein Enr17x_61020 [Gimesia fumaroli]
MDQTFQFFTDTATLAIFDPQCLQHRAADIVDWWCDDVGQLEEVKTGVIALVSLGGDGVYQARITDDELTSDERDYAAELVENLGVDVVSGALFIGPGECLPGGDAQFSSVNEERGILLKIPNGKYCIEVYSIDWFESPRWWTENQQPPENAPADYVAVLRSRMAPLDEINSEPRFTGDTDQFLFESATRLIGPQPGMVLSTKVRKGPHGLTLRECGPCDYTPSLIDYSDVAWKDTIRFQVISVDHEAREMTGEFLEKVEAM